MSFCWHALRLDDTTSPPVRPCLGSLAAAHRLRVCARPSVASLAALFHVASLGSNALRCAAVALSAPLADSMLAVPSASTGAVPTIGSTPPHSLDGRIPSHPSVGVGYHSRSRLCVSMHQGSTSLVSVSAITAMPPPMFVHINAQGVDFPRVRIGDHSRAPPPPRLCTSMHEGSTSLAYTSTITAALPPPPICAHQCMRGQFPSRPCRQSQPPLYVSMPEESTSSSLVSASVFAPY